MRLIALLVAIVLAEHSALPAGLRSARWFDRYAARMRRALRRLRLWDGIAGVVILVLPPVLAVAIMQWALGDYLLGDLVLGVPAMLFAFGADRSRDHVRQFAGAWGAGDMAAARAAVRALEPGVTLPSQDERLPEAAVRGLFAHGHERMFGALFWFVLVGPAGAIGYRLVALARNFAGCHDNAGPRFCAAAQSVFRWLSWLPVRGLALAFALAGSFVHCMEGWRGAHTAGARENRDHDLLVATGLGALGLPPVGADRDVLEKTLEDAQSLQGRARMIWLALIALLTLAGWIV